MTKSPLAVARRRWPWPRSGPAGLLLEVLQEDYTQHQLFALLALREFLKIDYRGLEQILREWADLRDALGLTEVPDHSTIQKAAERLLEKRGPMPSSARPSPAPRARRLIPPKPQAADRRHRVRDPARQPLLRLAVRAAGATRRAGRS